MSSEPSAERDQPRHKQGPVSCAECRRSRLKCDRQVPCSSCVQRKCANLCPDGVKPARRSQKDEKEFQMLREKIESLEGALSTNQDRRSRSPSRRQSSSYNDRPSVSPKSPFPHWSFANSLSQSARIPTPPSYRYQETQGGPLMQSPAKSITDVSAGIQPVRPDPGPSTSGTGTGLLNKGFESGVGRGPEPSPNEHSHGTLVIDKTGRSRYFGATAGTEWLKNQEVGGDETPWRSRSPSAPAAPPLPAVGVAQLDYFPFASPRPTIEKVLEQLPPYDEAQSLVDSYYRYYAWNHDAAPRTTFQPVFERAYAQQSSSREDKVHLQQLALIFAILAVGTHHNLELPPNDSGSGDFVNMARLCLTADDFLNHNTIFGIQTILILGHYCLETEKGRTGDTAWPMWGIASRMVIAMGLHRDGERWNLPPEVVQERRQVFWEAQTIDCLQANCFSRPGPLGLKHIDTAFPAQDPLDAPPGASNFFTLKYRIAQFSGRIIDEGMTTGSKSYSNVQALYQELCEFERQIPFHLRCRTSLLALPSVYPDPTQATRDSPEVSRRNLKRTLQQFTLALNVAENIMFLQRPYFVSALNENPQDPTKSMYGHSYLVVVERCNAIILIVQTLFETHPACLSRHWFFWYHLFTAAVCLGTLILNHPQNVLSEFALGQIDVASACYAELLRTTSSRTLMQNHEWLVRLRARCSARMAQSAGKEARNPASRDEEDGDVELLGWRTRLIERAQRGGQKATTIPAGAVHPSPMSIDGLLGGGGARLPTVQQVMQQHYMPQSDHALSFQHEPVLPGQANGMDHSTDMLLHQFWDPLLESGDNTSVNWWNWDARLDETGYPAGNTEGQQSL